MQLVYIGCATLVAWVAYPFIPSFDMVVVPGKPPVRASSNISGNSVMRLALLPLLPYIFTNLQSPTLPKPLPEPFVHPAGSKGYQCKNIDFLVGQCFGTPHGAKRGGPVSVLYIVNH